MSRERPPRDYSVLAWKVRTPEQEAARVVREHQAAQSVARFYRDHPKVQMTLTEHLLCLVATLLTGGLFLPVWIYLASRRKP